MDSKNFIEKGREDCLVQIKIEEEVGELLVKKGLSISTAESCTGGLLSGKLINYPGISKVFMEGIITYSNDAKKNRLGVNKETLERCGAVSSETASEMAIGIARVSGSDIGVSVTGIAGPSGGTIEKPVGLVFVGLYINGKTKVEKYNFSGERQSVRNQTVSAALELLKKELLNSN
jgi:PncC family amidohydrolase